MDQEFNPPAFPHKHGNSLGESVVHEPGMSLRDWFAGQALAGFCAARSEDLDDNSSEGIALMSYRYADAMLQIRTVKESK